MEIKSYRDLSAWQLGVDLVEVVYGLSSRFPDSEKYALANQIQRAAISVPSNIAEGHARDSSKDFLRFLSISLGSLAELETQLILAERLKYLGGQEAIEVQEKADKLGRMIRGLQKSLKARL